ncbi:MAG: TlpA family protein disulfide reductase, partial [Acidimicrobiales bacterium]
PQQTDTAFEHGVDFVGVDVADPRAAAQAFTRRVRVHDLLVADDDGAVASGFRVDALRGRSMSGRQAPSGADEPVVEP